MATLSDVVTSVCVVAGVGGVFLGGIGVVCLALYGVTLSGGPR